jgi:alkylhydroperoxidase family enzyme
VVAVLRDVDSSPLDDRHKALFHFVDRVNRDSPQLTAEALDGVRALGWSDEALYDAISVCALFNFYNRWVDAGGVHAMSDEAHREGGRRMAREGYVRS